jgi:hypothetical protein
LSLKSHITRYQHYSTSISRANRDIEGDQDSVRMPSRELTNLILALLHSVVGSRHRYHGRRGGRRHRRTVLAPAPPPSPPSTVPHCRVLERLLSPSPDRSVYRPMEPLDPNASPWGRRRRLCAVHGWGCPNRVTPDQGPSSSSRQGEEMKRMMSTASWWSLAP